MKMEEQENLNLIPPTATLEIDKDLTLLPRIKLNLTVHPSTPSSSITNQIDEWKTKRALLDFLQTSHSLPFPLPEEDLQFKRFNKDLKKRKREDPVVYGTLHIWDLSFLSEKNENDVELNLQGVRFRLEVDVPECDDFDGMKKNWEEFYAFRNVNRSSRREPDTVVVSGVPSRWFAETRVSSKPSMLVTHTIFSKFGKISVQACKLTVLLPLISNMISIGCRTNVLPLYLTFKLMPKGLAAHGDNSHEFSWLGPYGYKPMVQQQQLSLSRNSSRKKDESPYRRNPLRELESNSMAIPHSATNYNNSRMQNRSNMEVETEAKQKPNASRIALDKGVDAKCKTKIKQDEDVKVMSSMTDNVVVKTVVPPVVENLKPQILTRSRSSRRSRDLELDLNPEDLLIPPQSYTSLLLEDIQNFHQKNTPPPPSVSLPACVARACSILEAVANLNSDTSSSLSGVEDRRSPSGYQSSRNRYNVPLGTSNSYGKRAADTKDPIVESELIVYDEMVEPSLHKFETMNMGSPNMEKQESSRSSSLSVSSVAGRVNVDGAKKKVNSKTRV
ncbi:hypothetical protein KIW84_076242 [Lathyrus oleraceus]|uniref:Uncharacterized protein n=4 Tax=Pisum sativum TaxID=3888 RepID=A0A9D5A358_PEA|nr:hypothetical protein KIW84_076242 [Pisum sativum]